MDDTVVKPPIADGSPASLEALKRLWQGVIAKVRIRHPDPNTVVRIEAVTREGRGVYVYYLMDQLRDTSNPDRIMPPGFRHYIQPGLVWPGERAAEVLLAAGWGLYMMHEAFELATIRKDHWPVRQAVCTCGCGDTLNDPIFERPLVDAHDNWGLHQEHLQRTVRDVEKTMAWAVGEKEARQIIQCDAAKAEAELKAEMDPWYPGT